MSTSLADSIRRVDALETLRPFVNNRFHIQELERHRSRLGEHLGRLLRRPETDVLGSMTPARSQSTAEAIENAEAEIEAIELIAPDARSSPSSAPCAASPPPDPRKSRRPAWRG